jgi:hypothetical protein
MGNVLEFVSVQGGHTVRALNDGSQLAVAEWDGSMWVAETHPNGTRWLADTAQEALLLALGIEVQANIESGEFIATQYSNGMVSYKDKE